MYLKVFKAIQRCILFTLKIHEIVDMLPSGNEIEMSISSRARTEGNMLLVLLHSFIKTADKSVHT